MRLQQAYAGGPVLPLHIGKARAFAKVLRDGTLGSPTMVGRPLIKFPLRKRLPLAKRKNGCREMWLSRPQRVKDGVAFAQARASSHSGWAHEGIEVYDFGGKFGSGEALIERLVLESNSRKDGPAVLEVGIGPAGRAQLVAASDALR